MQARDSSGRVCCNLASPMTKQRVVRHGECLATIAEAEGLLPITIWEHPDNAGLRERRRDGQVLLAGDVLAIPNVQSGVARCATGAKHTFQRKAVPTPFELRVVSNGRRRVELPYTLRIGDRVERGATDATGTLRTWLPRDARRAHLSIEVDGTAHEYDIVLGGLDPINTPSGLRHRLENLRYLDPDAVSPAALERAIRSIQLDSGLEPTGHVDAATEDAIVALHGS
jgi:hypothetical protein